MKKVLSSIPAILVLCSIPLQYEHSFLPSLWLVLAARLEAPTVWRDGAVWRELKRRRTHQHKKKSVTWQLESYLQNILCHTRALQIQVYRQNASNHWQTSDKNTVLRFNFHLPQKPHDLNTFHGSRLIRQYLKLYCNGIMCGKPSSIVNIDRFILTVYSRLDCWFNAPIISQRKMTAKYDGG